MISASFPSPRRGVTWNWKFEIQDVNLFGRFIGSRWCITWHKQLLGLFWFWKIWSGMGGFGICNLEDMIWNMWLGITALGGIMWEPSILLINGSWKLISIFSIHIFLSPNYICTQEDSTMDIGGGPSSNWSALKTWDETCKTWFPCHFGLLLLLLLCMLHQANGHGLGLKFC